MKPHAPGMCGHMIHRPDSLRVSGFAIGRSDRPDRSDRSATLGFEPGREQLVEELGVALDTGRLRGLHALADKKAHDLRIAVPVLPDLVRATTEDLKT